MDRIEVLTLVGVIGAIVGVFQAHIKIKINSLAQEMDSLRIKAGEIDFLKSRIAETDNLQAKTAHVASLGIGSNLYTGPNP